MLQTRAFYQSLFVIGASSMSMYLVKLLLFVAIASLAVSQESKESETNDQEVETIAEENNRDKRGFIITPLSALPTEALAPLLPYLRATLPPHVLNKVAAFLPPAQLIADPANLVATSPDLPAILSATAPLITDRAIAAAAVPTAPVFQATPVAAAQRVTAPLLPAAPPTVANPPVVTLSRLATPVVATQRFSSTILPAAPPTVANPSLVTLSRYAAAPAYPAAQFLSPVAAAAAQYVPQYAYAAPSAAVPDAGFAAARFTAQSGLFPSTTVGFLPANAPVLASRFVTAAAAPNSQFTTLVPNTSGVYAARFVSPSVATPQVVSTPEVVAAARVAAPVVVPRSNVGVVQQQQGAVISPYANLVNYPSVPSSAQVNGGAPISSIFFGTAPGRVAVVTK